VDERLKSTVY